MLASQTIRFRYVMFVDLSVSGPSGSVVPDAPMEERNSDSSAASSV